MARLRALVRRGYLPESVALVLIGMVIGQVLPSTRSLISAEVVLLAFVPGLVFDAAFDLDWRTVRGILPALGGLAVPGVVVSAAVVALALSFLGTPLELAFVVGAITAATDPVAVVAILTKLRMPGRLRTLVEGESLLNDGTGLVLVALAVEAVTHGLVAGEATALFVITIVVSVAAGIGAGVVGAILVRQARYPLLAFGISLVLAYTTYALTAAVGLSGVLATVVTATTLGNLLRRQWSDAVLAHRLDRAWAVVAFVLSALTFLSIGAVIDLPSLGDNTLSIVAGVLAIIAARALIVYVPFAILRPRVPLGWAHVLFWSGLRGAIAFAAALALPVAFPQRLALQEIAFGIVFVTLVLQGATAQLVVRRALPSAERDD